MIEKIRTTEQGLYNEHGTFLGTMSKDTDSLTLANKINELVDAVNKLDALLDLTNTTIQAIKNETPADPYAEQRKWIGKLCMFSNGDGFDEVGYLTEIDPDMPEYKFRCNCHDYYEQCKPIKPDDDIIYKGGNNE